MSEKSFQKSSNSHSSYPSNTEFQNIVKSEVVLEKYEEFSENNVKVERNASPLEIFRHLFYHSKDSPKPIFKMEKEGKNASEGRLNDSTTDMSCLNEITTDALELDVALEGKDFCECFMEFLKYEHSEENLEFYLHVERFKKLNSPQQIKIESKLIFEKYIYENCDNPINIDSNASQATLKFENNPNSSMFDVCEDQIYNLMKGDCYPRFLQSKHYKQSTKNLPSFSSRNKLLIPLVDNRSVDESKQVGARFLRAKSNIFVDTSNTVNRKILETRGNLTMNYKIDGKKKVIILPKFDEKVKTDKNLLRGRSFRVYFNERNYILTAKEGSTISQLIEILNIPNSDSMSYYAFLLPQERIIDTSQNSIYFQRKTIEIKRFSLMNITLSDNIIALKCSYESPLSIAIDSILAFYSYSMNDILNVKLKNKKPVGMGLNCGKFDRMGITCNLKKDQSF
ncbi:hypothetical protein HZS_1099 [Henneguya salminicola]|nr:hypothetical protein HZS_1099 [Henneguya salminicola]